MIWCVLLVDDDNRFRSTLGQFLRRAGYLVDDVERGTDAVGLIEKRRFDLLITDYNLWDTINGADVIAKFNQLQPRKGKILISGDLDLKSRCDSLGALYLHKPLLPSDFLRSIGGVLKQQHLSFIDPANLRSIENARSVRATNWFLKDRLKRLRGDNLSLTARSQESMNKWKIEVQRLQQRRNLVVWP